MSFLTFDSGMYSADAGGNQMGRRFDRPYMTHDGLTVDSTGAFLVGELERLDQKLHEPLASVTWGRDMDLRTDVTIADEVSSFTLSTYASAGGLGTGNVVGTGKAWIGKDSTQITGLSLDIAKIPHPLTLWGMELKWTIPELESAAKLGRPVDQQKFAGMQLKHQMDVDEQVYIGDLALGFTGLVNSTGSGGVTNSTAPTGALGSSTWVNKTPDEILLDVNLAITTSWQNAGWAVVPGKLLIPPAQYGYVSTQKVSAAGNQSILKYLVENNLLAQSGQKQLEIQPVKWCIGAASANYISTGHTDRLVAYTQEEDRIRFPMTPLQRTPVQFDAIWHKSTYFGRLGVVEVVYPETVFYLDGIASSNIHDDVVAQRFAEPDVMGNVGVWTTRKQAIL